MTKSTNTSCHFLPSPAKLGHYRLRGYPHPRYVLRMSGKYRTYSGRVRMSVKTKGVESACFQFFVHALG